MLYIKKNGAFPHMQNALNKIRLRVCAFFKLLLTINNEWTARYTDWSVLTFQANMQKCTFLKFEIQYHTSSTSLSDKYQTESRCHQFVSHFVWYLFAIYHRHVPNPLILESYSAEISNAATILIPLIIYTYLYRFLISVPPVPMVHD